MQQTVDLIVIVTDPSSALPSTGDSALLAFAIALILGIVATTIFALRNKLGKHSKTVFKSLALLLVVVLSISPLLTASPAFAVPTPTSTTLTITKDPTSATQSVIALPLEITNAAGTGTAVRINATSSDLTHATGTFGVPVSLSADTVGFALLGNPTATSTNTVVNNFSQNYSPTQNSKDHAQTFAGLTAASGSDIIRCETTGTTTQTIYLSAKVSPSLAAGTYHVSILIETASYPLMAAGSSTIMVQAPGNPEFLNTGIDRSLITGIAFSNVLPTPVPGTNWDVSEAQDKSVIAELNGTTLIIGAAGGVAANVDSTYLFSGLTNLTSLNFNHFSTQQADDMTAMFAGSTLPAGFVLPAGFGSTATNMYGMFFYTTLSAAGFSFPPGFGSEAKNMWSMFYGATLPTTDFSFPPGFGSKAENMEE